MVFDLFKLGKLNQALKIGQLAYSQVSSIPPKLNEDKHEDWAQVRLYIAQIQLALLHLIHPSIHRCMYVCMQHTHIPLGHFSSLRRASK